MGCASSGPLGKNLVDGAQDTLGQVGEMGGNALHGVEDMAKDGMGHVKDAMESAMHTAEHGIGTAIEKIEETIGLKKEEAQDHITEEMKNAVEGFEEAAEEAEHNATEAVHKVTDGVTEEISEAETVLASEAEAPLELIPMTEAIPTPPPPVEDNLKVEDMEENADDGMGSTVQVEAKKDVEELVAHPEETSSTPPPETPKEEDLTPWERAADANLNRPLNPSMSVTDVDVDNELNEVEDILNEVNGEEAINKEIQVLNNEETDELKMEDLDIDDQYEEKEKMFRNHLDIDQITENLVA